MHGNRKQTTVCQDGGRGWGVTASGGEGNGSFWVIKMFWG